MKLVKRLIFSNNIGTFTFLCIISVALFTQILHSGFFFLEDHKNITNNIRIELNLENFLWFWKNSLDPVAVNIWQLLHSVFSIEQASTYRAVNVLTHTINSFIVYKIFDNYITKKESNNIEMLPLMASLIFLAHPAQVEAVVWISSFKYLICGTFALAAIYLSSFKDSIHHSTSILALFILSILSAPISILLPVILIAGDRLIHKYDYKKILSRNFLLIIVFAFALINYSNRISKISSDISLFSYIKVFFVNLTSAFSTFFFPMNLSVILNSKEYIPHSNIFDISVTIISLALIAFFTFKYKLIRNAKLTLALISFFALFIPISGILFDATFFSRTLENRTTYLLTLAPIALFILFLKYLKISPTGKRNSLIILLVLFSITTSWQINKWHSSKIFKGSRNSSSEYRYQRTLGNYHLEKWNLEEAAKHFNMALENKSMNYFISGDLMRVLMILNRFDDGKGLAKQMGISLRNNIKAYSYYLELLANNQYANKAIQMIELDYKKDPRNTDFNRLYEKALNLKIQKLEHINKVIIKKNIKSSKTLSKSLENEIRLLETKRDKLINN
jgi:hypothetical protein